jgi:hypothetical protein
MDKPTDHIENKPQGQIPDSSQYIPESTLIPESVSVMPESSTVDVVGDDGLPGGGAYGVSKKDQKKSFVKQNMPFLVIGGVVVLFGGVFLSKSLNTSSPTVPSPIVSIAPVKKSVSEGPPVKAEAVVVKGGISPTTENLSYADIGMKSSVNEVKKIDEIPLTGTSYVLDKKNKDAENSDLLAAVQENLKRTQDKLNAADAKLASCLPVSTASSGQVKKIVHSNHHHTSMKKEAGKSKELPVAEGFNLHVVKNGLAWVKDEDGKTMTLRKGDSLSGVGIVTAIDDKKMIMTVGGKTISQH